MKLMKRVLCIVTVLTMLVPMMTFMSNAATYTVTFNANTGTGGPGYVTTGGTLTIPAAEPSKDAMTFRGWATTAENAAVGIVAYSHNAKYGGSSKITVTGNTMLFAVWAYTVKLSRGAEGAGTSVVTKYKFPGADLELLTSKSGIKSSYGMYPAGNGQRSFIEWNTAQDSTTSKGVGTAFRSKYNVNANTTLYAIWGYPIQYNADGGSFPETGNSIFLKYVCDCDDNNYQNPKTLYGNFDLPEGSNKPVKKGCRLYTMSDGRVFYALLNSDMSFFTTETAQQNLTIPPTGGKLPWSVFHTTTTEYGDTAVEFYAIWEPSVTYKANGGEGEDVVEYIEWDWDGLHIYDDYYVKGDIFTKQGAELKGWNTKPDGSGKSYSIGKNIGGERSNSDPITLYAQWEDKKYTVKYNANGGEGAPAAQTKTDGVDLKLSTVIPKRTGYIFEGWSEDKNAETPTYLAGSVYTKNKGVTLYAVWEDIARHTYSTVYDPAPTCTSEGVAYHTCVQCGFSYVENLLALPHTYGEWSPNGDGTQSRICSVCTYTDTDNCTYTITYENMEGAQLGEGTPTTHTYGVTTYLVAPTKTGYTFAGWHNERGTTVTTLTKTGYTDNITLTAKWTANSYKITYKDKGNATFSGKLPSVYNKTHSYGTETLLPVPAKTGYFFRGWYTDKACETTAVEVIGATDITASITLYAKWEKKIFNITYRDMGDADFSGVHPSGTPVIHTWGVNTNLKKPTKLGYLFSGWYLDPECTGTKVSSLPKSSYNDDITLYAKWTPVSYTIGYKDKAGATFTGKLPSGYIKKHTYNTETTLPIPTKTGYTFLGWYLDKACNTDPVTVLGATDYTSTVYVYAKWQVNSYTITYRDMGDNDFSGTHPSGTPTVHTYGKNTTLKKPTKVGYTFSGWYLNPQCTGSKLSSLAKSSYKDDITLYAKWTAYQYTITYRDKGNGTFTGTMPSGYATKHTYDSDTTLPVPTRKGYTFKGWYFDRACETSPVTVLGGKDHTASFNLYAKWEANVYTVTYLDKGGNEFSGVLANGTPMTHTYNKTTTLKNPTREGYTFGGWYTNASCTKKVTSLSKTGYTADIILYAKWTAK